MIVRRGTWVRDAAKLAIPEVRLEAEDAGRRSMSTSKFQKRLRAPAS